VALGNIIKSRKSNASRQSKRIVKMNFIGIDPGQNGALALISNNLDVLALEDWPGDTESAATLFRSLYLEYHPHLVCLESVNAMPKQGVVSMFKLGHNLGSWQGVISALGARYRLVRPREWQSKMFDPGTGKEPKQRSLTTARRLFPDTELHLKKHHGRSDALLLAYYGLCTWCVLRGSKP
jgi:hypothetical protein